MQPLAADIEHDVAGQDHGLAASADPVARFEDENGQPRIFQRARGSKAGRTGADDRNIDVGGNGHSRPGSGISGGPVPAIHDFSLTDL